MRTDASTDTSAVAASLPETGLPELVTAYLNGQLTLTPDGCEHHDGHHHHE
jgi:hypothetical protein